MSGVKKAIFFVLLLFALQPISASSFAQTSVLQSGPMVCFSEMREVSLWVQTNEQAIVRFEYWEKHKPEEKHSTISAEAIKFYGYTCELIADEVEPGKTYEYTLFINEKPVDRPYPLEFRTPALWQWRGNPPEFTVAVGSCAYINEAQFDRPGKGYGGGYEIFESIHKKRPDLMLWLGDNVYYREPDWNTRTGMIYRYTHTRSLPELQPLLGSTHHYAIWDDHDYGPNNSDRSFWNKDNALEVFKLFWGNPSYGVNGMPGVTTQFQWGDVDFFLLDNRFFRTPDTRKTGDRTLLGKEQFEWLIDALCTSQATFKIIAIGGQVLNSVADFETYATYGDEREHLIDEITKNNISGVIFVSGDRHFAELSKLPRDGNYPLYEVTTSPLTSGPYIGAAREQNKYREKGTIVTERNFATMTFSGSESDRKVTITVFNTKGEKLWSKTIEAAELRNL
ncbi:phosphodiesterase I [Chloroherpeton thalassium ATCC 35110]|uniref:Phosphodiesterase I n=1 Tax=Chloroherpeton thalassium (strain ATCC 35110 / GB-78) TaxID=517418 RepID=B3QW46_CHLT3|nr:alkaline phosphatase D family protein [Chloroherpeton thalassium]ACF14700.1 phosphodiesterase I [Chloroherpeton thalassium ATCC 35110]